MSSNDNLIVCSDINGKISDFFKVSPKNIDGSSPIIVSQQYKDYKFNKMSFMGSGEFTGIYYDDTAPNGQDKGNNLGCKGFYVHGWELVSITFTNPDPENSNDTVILSNTDLDTYLSDKCKLYNKVGTALNNNVLKQVLQNNSICEINEDGNFVRKLTDADVDKIKPGKYQVTGSTDKYVRYLCLGTNNSLATLSKYPDYTKSGTTYKYSSIKLKLHVRDEQISGFTSYLNNNKPKITRSSNYDITYNNIKYTSAANMPSLLKFKMFSDDPNLPVPTDTNTLGNITTQLQNISEDLNSYKNYKYSYTSNSHNTDIFNLIEVDSKNCTITVESNKVLNLLSLFANDPGVLTTATNGDKIYALRTYDTALYTYDDLDFGLYEIYPTCFAVGTGNTVAGDGAIATGMGSKAMGAFSAAFGRSSQARGYSAFAAGHKSKALIEKSVALGNSCETLGISSFAAGYQSIANKDYSVALGDRCITGGTGAFAAGRLSEANSNYSVALGNSCETLGISSFAAGYQSIANKDYSVALGCQCITGNNATGAFAAGYQSKANNNYSVALGVVCETLGTSSFAAGYKSKVVNANYSVALGNNCIAKAANSFAMGYQCITNNAYSVALGNNCITGAGSQCVVGKYNCKNSTAVFAVGYGNSEDVTVESTGKKYKKINGKNIFEVVTDGQIVVPIQGATDRFASIRVVLNKDTNNIELICSEVDVVKDPRTGTIWLDSDGNEVADPTK